MAAAQCWQGQLPAGAAVGWHGMPAARSPELLRAQTDPWSALCLPQFPQCLYCTSMWMVMPSRQERDSRTALRGAHPHTARQAAGTESGCQALPELLLALEPLHPRANSPGSSTQVNLAEPALGELSPVGFELRTLQESVLGRSGHTWGVLQRWAGRPSAAAGP